MSNLDRRALLAAVPAAVATAARPAVAMPSKEEWAVTRVYRLSEELADAMDEWMNDLSNDQQARLPLWIAHVYPASQKGGVIFENGNANPPLVSKQMTAAIDAHRKAWRKLRRAPRPKEPAYKSEQDALEALCGMRPVFELDAHIKSQYLKRFGQWFTPAQIAALLHSQVRAL